MSTSSVSKTGARTPNSSRKNSTRSVQPDARSNDYEYFQLYDPEDSDIADEVDPDVRNLLTNSWSGSGSYPRRNIKNGLIADLVFCRCCCSPYAW